jgi:hypothetical protein
VRERRGAPGGDSDDARSRAVAAGDPAKVPRRDPSSGRGPQSRAESAQNRSATPLPTEITPDCAPNQSVAICLDVGIYLVYACTNDCITLRAGRMWLVYAAAGAAEAAEEAAEEAAGAAGARAPSER